MEQTAHSPESYPPFDDPFLEGSMTAETEEDQQAQLNTSIEQRFAGWPRSHYTDVSVLLLRWAADNLGVIDEVLKLEKTFRERYNFSTEQWDIPSEEPEYELTSKMFEFCKGKTKKNHLLILYYAGHSGGGPEECIWSATQSTADSPWLNWHKIQGHLLEDHRDVLLILDSCFSSLAAGVHSIGANWFLGSSVKESVALGVSWRSFTSAMVRQLERAANRYWDDKIKYSVQSLSSDLHFRETDLLVSPNLLRLNSNDCPPTDLTPLLDLRQRRKLVSARTEPVASIPRGSILSKPLRNDYNSLPPTGLTKVDDRPSPAKANNLVAFDVAVDECQTLRINGVPADAKAEHVIRRLRTILDSRLIEVRLGPLVAGSSTQSTTATFANLAQARMALAAQRGQRESRAGQHQAVLEIDQQFSGFTTIYDSSPTSNNQPIVDVILVHDLYGHPINTFASHYVAPTQRDTTIEECWPRDQLPHFLEADGIYCRIMTYGWPASSWLQPNEPSWRVVDDFMTRLRELRSHLSSTTRPLIFIGHGIGGILIKHAVLNLINFGLGEDDFQNPVKLCVFFGVPNRGLKQEDDFASILEKLSAVVLDANSPPTPSSGLQRWNGQLINISKEFAQLQSLHDIEVLSLIGKPGKQSDMVIPSHCASFDQAPGKSKTLDIGANHQHLAKLRRGDDGATDALKMICSAASRKLGKKPDPSSDPGPVRTEDIYERLRHYDTFFLVDDSGSMEPHWRTIAHVLANIVSIAVKYDDDGVDVKFFNKRIETKERTHLDTTEKVMQLFARNLPPRGGTLTADVLDEVLNDYMFRYRRNSEIKGLNLVVLTDGEPDPGQDVEEVLKDYATQLKEAGAYRFKVGVQFVQIGGDEAARAFLNFLDDELKAKHKLDRDMIDTVYWEEGDRDHLHEKILLGGILKRLDNEQPKHPPP
ncbi:MAG: hypothetical protein Q9207_003895 [Kuettlingeria erythrocarpa]